MRFSNFTSADVSNVVTLESGLKYAKGVTVAGKPTLMVWTPKAKRPCLNYYYQTEEARDAALEVAIKNFNAHKEYVKKSRLDCVPTAEQIKSLKKGQLFYTSWGYDQTNYDFLAVIEVSETGKTCVCQMVSPMNMGTGVQTDVLEPVFCPVGEKFTMRVYGGKGSICLRGNYPYCGNDSKRLGTFSQHEEGKQYHQTDAYSGH